jgi:hypothetical protein
VAQATSLLGNPLLQLLLRQARLLPLLGGENIRLTNLQTSSCGQFTELLHPQGLSKLSSELGVLNPQGQQTIQIFEGHQQRRSTRPVYRIC